MKNNNITTHSNDEFAAKLTVLSDLASILRNASDAASRLRRECKRDRDSHESHAAEDSLVRQLNRVMEQSQLALYQFAQEFPTRQAVAHFMIANSTFTKRMCHVEFNAATIELFDKHAKTLESLVHDVTEQFPAIMQRYETAKAAKEQASVSEGN